MDLHEEAERLALIWEERGTVEPGPGGGSEFWIVPVDCPDALEVARTLRALSARLAEVERERDEARARVADALKMSSEYERWLGELLAVIHRDGGYHLNENGPEASTQDAISIWADLMAQVDQATSERDEWQQAFAAQSRKLQSVLHIEGVKDALARPEETDALDRIRAEVWLEAAAIVEKHADLNARQSNMLGNLFRSRSREDKT